MNRYNIRGSLEAREARKEKFFRLGKLLREKRTGVHLYLDGILTYAFREFHIDIMKLEQEIPNYDWENCIYKGKPDYSVHMAVKEEFGDEIAQLIKDLL